MYKSRQLVTTVLGIAALGASFDTRADIDPVTGRAVGDVSARNFAEYCAGDLERHRTERFYFELETAEKAIAAGDGDIADTAMGRARNAVYRGGAETDINVKCLGRQTASRWFATRLSLYRLQASQSPQGQVGDAQLYTAARDGGSEAVVALVRNQPAARFRGSLGRLEWVPERVDNEREYGAFILPEEQAIATTFGDAAIALRQIAKQNHQAAMAAEDRAFNREPTEQELAAAKSMANVEVLAQAMAGVEVDTAAQREASLTGIRVNESKEHLRDARDWNLDRVADVSELPSSRRARQRADTMLAMANDPQRPLEVRDDFYRDAEWYYEFGKFEERAQMSSSQRAAIQPALRAEQEQREREIERARADMQQRAETTQQAVEDMQKTEAEKKSFNEEADALEAELGF